MDNYSLHELNEYIRRIISLNCPAPLWVRFELAQVSESRGHFYLNLIEKDPETGQIIAESQGVIWQNNYRRLRRKLGKTLDGLLQNGMVILAKVQVEYHERYGLKLMIDEIDPSYTLGQLEVERKETILRLKKENLLDLNKTKPLPIVVQRIAIISSETAAGYKDFIKQVKSNAYGYQYRTSLFPAAMQGEKSVPEIICQIQQINQRPQDYDCIVIVRGGGARLDLMAFDKYELCSAIAQSQLPVLIGIGHEVDDVLADIVAHGSFKTPTAVGAFLVEKNMFFESQLIDLQQVLVKNINHRLEASHQTLNRFEQIITLKSQTLIDQNSRMLDYIEQELPRQFKRSLKDAERDVEHLSKQVELLRPDKILERGYALVLKENQIIDSAGRLGKQEKVKLRFKDGERDALIE